MKSFYLLTIVFVFVAFSCKDKNLYPDISHVQADVNLIPFYKEFHQIDTLNVKASLQPILLKYPEFTEAYNKQIIRLGSSKAEQYPQRVYDFVTYNANKDICKKAEEVFPNHELFSQKLKEGFTYLKYYFPEIQIPDVYLMISGFSQSIAVDSAWVGVSIEKYLGENCVFYEWLNIPKYLRKGMTKEKMAPDVIRAMALTYFTYDDKKDDLINNMIYKGKIKYFVHRMYPDLSDTLLFDYSTEQMKWCKNHEEDMWASLVEWKHLFNNDRLLIQKYTGDAPFTANFGNNSAPRAGEYLGFRIIQSYMKNNPEHSLKQLMNEKDGHKILADSKYRP
jgi:hypothetical protein